MKDQIKTILIAAGCGILIWVADTLLDQLIFYSSSGSFLELLILSPPGHEIYIRIIILLVFILFGYFISENVKKQKFQRKNLKRTLNSIGDAVISTDVEGKILRMNPVAEKLTGWNKKEAIGESIKEVFNIVNVDTPEKVKNPVTKVLEQGKTVGLANHTVLISKDGDEYQISDSGAPIYDEDDNITGVVLVFRDVTEEYQLREELKQNEQKYRTVFENTGTATIIIEEDTTISLANKEFTKLLGLSKEKIEGKISWTEFVADEDLERMKKYHRLRRKKGEKAPNQYEFKMIDREGEEHDIFIVIDMIPGTKQTVASFMDITERKQMEEELRQSEKRFRILSESSPVGIYQTDKNGDCKYVNEKWLEIAGMDYEEALGKGWKEAIHPEDKEVVFEQWYQTIQSTGKWNDEYRFINEQGDITWVYGTAKKIMGDDGELVGYIGINLDITKRKKAEAEKEKLQEQLYQKQKLQSIGTLAGGVAHDFNNLLTVILGMSDLAMKQSNNTGVKSKIKEIRKAGEKAAKLTDQLLLFSREKDIEFEIINLNKTIQALEKMLKRLIGEDITIHDEFEENIWKIRADEGQIEQIITNMAINAQDAMPEGGDLYISTKNITLDKEKARTIPDIQSGSYVRLEIEDTGEGMDEETQDKIFDPFFTTKGRSEGTGMGLSVVHGIVKNHDGLINVYSEPGEGTVFRIYFPAIKKQEETQQKSGQAKKDLDKYKGQGETILVVEDEEPVINYIENILETYDYSYYSVESAEAALDIWEDNQKEIELLLSDMILPGRNGLELADELKGKNPDLNVILNSGYSDKKISSTKVQNKGYKFVKKPFDIRDLLQSVYEAINEGR